MPENIPGENTAWVHETYCTDYDNIAAVVCAVFRICLYSNVCFLKLPTGPSEEFE